MQMKSILAGAAIALLAGLGSAFASEELNTKEVTTIAEFATLGAMAAEPLDAAEMAVIVGKINLPVGSALCDKGLDILTANGLRVRTVSCAVCELQITGFPGG